MEQKHHYKIKTVWTGNTGNGTSSVAAYERTHRISNGEKPELVLTTDNKKFGDAKKLNPEDLLVSALSSCHMMSYLYLCALEGVVVIAYEDNATGTMTEKMSGGGQFDEVTLNPIVTVADESMVVKATDLHHKAHEICYIANSVNFPVHAAPVCLAANVK